MGFIRCCGKTRGKRIQTWLNRTQTRNNILWCDIRAGEPFDNINNMMGMQKPCAFTRTILRASVNNAHVSRKRGVAVVISNRVPKASPMATVFPSSSNVCPASMPRASRTLLTTDTSFWGMMPMASPGSYENPDSARDNSIWRVSLEDPRPTIGIFSITVAIKGFRLPCCEEGNIRVSPGATSPG